MLRRCVLFALAAGLFTAVTPAAPAAPLRVAAFQADVTPPLGSPLCDGLVPVADSVVDPLSARGVVLLVEPPIVLCAVDWVGIGNAGHVAWREALAKAAGTTPDRVSVHCLHQHDAPGCDFLAEEIAAARGLGGKMFHVVFAREAIQRTADAVREAIQNPHTATHIGLGRAKVERVASNRRVMGPDGKVKYVRYSSTKDETIRAEPEGTIDPIVRLLSFWDGDRPIASLTYYATHPQSYYGQGDVSADFPGMARGLREKDQPKLAHIHFNGAGGNITAGKYNDGAPERRPELAGRLADGMKAAWESQQKLPIAADDVEWRVAPVSLPPRDDLAAGFLKTLDDSAANPVERLRAARYTAFMQFAKDQHVPLTCLRLGKATIVHMPGELFIEYQLAAQALRPDDFVAMAAYGDYGAGYIGTEISYTQGGYETGPVSRVAPQVEGVLMSALKQLLTPEQK